MSKMDYIIKQCILQYFQCFDLSQVLSGTYIINIMFQILLSLIFYKSKGMQIEMYSTYFFTKYMCNSYVAYHLRIIGTVNSLLSSLKSSWTCQLYFVTVIFM
jgi:hypothetical protein